MKLIKDLISLSEATAPGSAALSLDKHDLEQALKILKTECSDVKWMMHVEKFIYRGDSSTQENLADGYATIDTSKSVRVSQNATNVYTLILDNIHSRRDFPKRSKSIIATTDRLNAENYRGSSSGILYLFPYNTAKIGFVNKEDMWETSISLFGSEYESIKFMNGFLLKLLSASTGKPLSLSWSDFTHLAKLLKDGDEATKENFISTICNFCNFSRMFDINKAEQIYLKYKDHFLEELDRAYSGAETSHTWCRPSQLKPSDLSKNSELWIEGKVLVMTRTTVNELMNELLTR